MFEFTEMDKFHNLLKEIITSFQRLPIDPQTLCDFNSQDFETIDITINELFQRLLAIKPLISEEVDFNLISIEGESKSYLYVQTLYNKYTQLEDLYSDEFLTVYHPAYTTLQDALDALGDWDRKQNSELLEKDSYEENYRNTLFLILDTWKHIYDLQISISQQIMGTYWYAKYPEKFIGLTQQIGFDPLAYMPSSPKRFSGPAQQTGYDPIVYQPISPNGLKLKWKCQPAIAGFIISELVRAGYIDPPTNNGELSWSKLGTLCNQIFDVRSKEGNPTTLDYWKKVVNPESNQLPNYKRAKLHLPDLDELT